MVRTLLLFVFVFEQLPYFLKREEVPVHLNLILAAIVRNRNNVPNGVAMVTKSLGDELDINLLLHSEPLRIG
jgi:hypothetical protein